MKNIFALFTTLTITITALMSGTAFATTTSVPSRANCYGQDGRTIKFFEVDTDSVYAIRYEAQLGEGTYAIYTDTLYNDHMDRKLVITANNAVIDSAEQLGFQPGVNSDFHGQALDLRVYAKVDGLSYFCQAK